MNAKPFHFQKHSAACLLLVMWLIGCAGSSSLRPTGQFMGAEFRPGESFELIGGGDELREKLSSTPHCFDVLAQKIREGGGSVRVLHSSPTGTTATNLIAVVQPQYLELGPAPEPGYTLNIGAYEFDPRSRVPIIPTEWCKEPEGRGEFYVVQLSQVPGDKERADLGTLLTKAGPGLGYLEKLGATDVESQKGKVRAVEFVEPYMKIDPNLRRTPEGGIEGGIWIWHTKEASGRLKAFGVAEGSTMDDDIAISEFAPATTVEVVRKIAQDPGVLRLERAGVASLRSYVTSWTIQSDQQDVLPIFKHLDGSNQIIGLIDDYVDVKNCVFPGGVGANGKFIAYEGGVGQSGNPSVHGTTVASILAGAGNPASVNLKGQAPEAKIRFHWLWDLNRGQPTDLIDIWEAQYKNPNGARIFSNSWGDGTTDTYTAWSYQADLFSWKNEEALVLFAVNNELKDRVKSPENAKNVLAVGASEKPTREGFLGAGGHGFTLDGRRKPEIFAPGCAMFSATPGFCRSSSAGNCATSWATAAVAGGTALVREYFEEGFYPSGVKDQRAATIASGALLKAMLLNASVDMTGAAGYPSEAEGWGRVVLDRSLFFKDDDRQTLVLDVRKREGLTNQKSRSFDFSVVAGDADLRVTLVWTEPPPNVVTATSAMVNNLDLIVTQLTDNLVYYGNDFSGGQSKPCSAGSCALDVDNVEQVSILVPKVSRYRVTVNGTRVASAETQGFALVISGKVKKE